MKKRALIITTVSGFVPQFEANNVRILQKLGYDVHYASNFNYPFYGNDNTRLKKMDITCHQIDFERSPFCILKNIKAFRELKFLSEKIKFDIVHCHTPMGGVIGRIIFAGISGTKVLYTAHGFHFYKGAPIKNWIFYYPIERILAKYTGVLITLNQEDYKIAQKFSAKRVIYLPGVGIDLKQYIDTKSDRLRKEKRKELGLNEGTIMLLSVGELNANKNHETVIKSLNKLKNDNFHYFICGEGALNTFLQKCISELYMDNKVTLLGYRTDIYEIYEAADMFVFPSMREGLSVSLMEAMANGLPVVCGKIRGNIDLIIDDKGGFLIDSVKNTESFLKYISILLENKEIRDKMGEFNKKQIIKFGLEEVNRLMEKVYAEVEPID